MKQFKTLVYIGRFQPFHKAHLETIKIASKQCEQLIIIVGSDNSPRTVKNPFTSSERIKMIKDSIDVYNDEAQLDDLITIDIIYKTVEDSVYDDLKWSNRIKNIVSNHASENIGIIGHYKDDSSFYLKMFDWEFFNVERLSDVNATDIRYEFLNESEHSLSLDSLWYINRIGESSYKFLKEFIKTEDFKKLFNEYKNIMSYKASFKHLEYPPVFVTVDALLIVNNHLLVIRRKSDYGNGLLALCGGFLDAHRDKNLFSAMVRELSEETSLNISEDVLKNHLKTVKVFDGINRSMRGRTITHVHHIEMVMEYLPELNAGDDASDAFWISLDDIKRSEFFEDHYDIIDLMLNNN